jgi:hypothetical protein
VTAGANPERLPDPSGRDAQGVRVLRKNLWKVSVAALALAAGSGCSADSYWVQLGINNAADIANTLVTSSLLNLLGLG